MRQVICVTTVSSVKIFSLDHFLAMPREAKTPTAELGDDFIGFDWDDGEVSSENEKQVDVDTSVRAHAAARSTPWASHVPWHKCRNVAEMCASTVMR